MKRTYRLKPDEIEFNLIYHDDGVFAMCDLLGFSEYVLQNDDFEVYDTIINKILGTMITVKFFDVNKAFDYDTINKRYGEEWIENLSFSYKIISDSFIIYPNLEIKENTEQRIFIILLIGNMLRVIYSHILNLNKDILLRGVIMSGKYAHTNDYNVIMGKGIIDAYRYEKMQNWSGLLIHHKLHELLRDNDYQAQMGIPYEKMPFKKDVFSYGYNNELAKKGLNPYALNWVDSHIDAYKLIDESFWYDKIDTILSSDGENKQSAVDKILNTKQFYDYVIEQKELG